MFTYRELEIATDGFSEANVIGSNGIIGGHGLIYRGVLSDGTLAAIKLLRTEGKQGERAFRIEVSDSASFNDLLNISSFFFLSKRFNYFLFLLLISSFFFSQTVKVWRVFQINIMNHVFFFN